MTWQEVIKAEKQHGFKLEQAGRAVVLRDHRKATYTVLEVSEFCGIFDKQQREALAARLVELLRGEV